MNARHASLSVAVGAIALAGVAYTWSGGTRTTTDALVPVSALHAEAPPAHHSMPSGVSVPDDGPTLPPGARHGLAHRLVQYPALFLASPQQRAAAARLRTALFVSASQLGAPAAAEAAGFDLRRARRRPGERRVMWFHAENRRWHAARDGSLDLAHPDTLIYADLPGRPLRLVGVMISMPRALRGPTPGGPITRWHHHLVCVTDGKRGLAPRANGSCPSGAQLRTGSEMMHVWFTRDLRSSFAIHAPWPELCAAQLVPRAACASGRRFTGM